MIEYGSYKPSGIEWLGNVPIHWNIEKVKWIFRHVTEMSEKKNDHELLSVYTDIGVRPRKELEDRGNKASSTDNYWIVKKGDIVVNKLLAWMGAVGLSNYDGVTSPAYDVLRPIKDIDVRYYNYIFRSSQTLSEFKKRSKGIMEMRLRLYFDELGQILFPLPPKDEQKAIADFLDKKCESIDNYILKQKELIDLLKEKKSSLINRAVTRGLDSSVEYKDSEIEWLGEIPKHWEVKKLKYITKNLNNRRIPIESSLRGKMNNRKYDYYGATGIIDKVDNYIFNESTIIVAEDGANLVFRNIKLVYLADGKYWVNNHAHILKANRNYVREYIAYFLESFDYNRLISGSAQPKLTKEKFMNIDVSIPPIEEQKQIVNYIEKETKKIDDSITHIEDEIKLLGEYRQSIISSAVTGKIKV